MKRIIFVFLCFILAVAVFVACDSSGEEGRGAGSGFEVIGSEPDLWYSPNATINGQNPLNVTFPSPFVTSPWGSVEAWLDDFENFSSLTAVEIRYKSASTIYLHLYYTPNGPHSRYGTILPAATNYTTRSIKLKDFIKIEWSDNPDWWYGLPENLSLVSDKTNIMPQIVFYGESEQPVTYEVTSLKLIGYNNGSGGENNGGDSGNTWCSVCGGTGNCYYCGGTGLNDGGWGGCPGCNNGEGTCRTCNGTGYY